MPAISASWIAHERIVPAVPGPAQGHADPTAVKVEVLEDGGPASDAHERGRLPSVLPACSRPGDGQTADVRLTGR